MATATVLDIITVDSSRAALLRRRAKPVGKMSQTVQRLVDDMFATLQAANGWGLAAPQVGDSVRVLVARVEKRTVSLIDPEILEASGEETATEACLSIPGVLGDVPRATTIKVRGKNRRGRRVTINAEGLLARVLQHEIDHLDGILFLDRVRDRESIRVITPSENADEQVSDGTVPAAE